MDLLYETLSPIDNPDAGSKNPDLLLNIAGDGVVTQFCTAKINSNELKYTDGGRDYER